VSSMIEVGARDYSTRDRQQNLATFYNVSLSPVINFLRTTQQIHYIRQQLSNTCQRINLSEIHFWTILFFNPNTVKLGSLLRPEICPWHFTIFTIFLPFSHLQCNDTHWLLHMVPWRRAGPAGTPPNPLAVFNACLPIKDQRTNLI